MALPKSLEIFRANGSSSQVIPEWLRNEGILSFEGHSKSEWPRMTEMRDEKWDLVWSSFLSKWPWNDGFCHSDLILSFETKDERNEVDKVPFREMNCLLKSPSSVWLWSFLGAVQMDFWSNGRWPILCPACCPTKCKHGRLVVAHVVMNCRKTAQH